MKLRVLLAFLFIIVALTIYAELHALIGFYIYFAFGVHPAWLLWILGIASIFSLMLSRWKRNLFTTALYWLGTAWMGMMFIMVIVFLPFIVAKLFFATQVYPYVAIPLALALILIAARNARSPILKTVVISTEKISKPISIVQLTDMHIGEIYGPSFLQSVVDRVNKINPDVVVITGDLFDGGGKIYEGMMAPLKKLKAKHKFFITGNHEVYEGVEKTKKMVRQHGITVLDDEAKIVAGIHLAGLSYQTDFSDKKADVVAKLGKKTNKKQLSVLLRHEPTGLADAAKAGFDLQLSGHTHNGQLWPLSYIVSLIYEFRTGLHRKDDMTVYVGPGLGTWGPALRLGSRSEITLFKLVPARLL